MLSLCRALSLLLQILSVVDRRHLVGGSSKLRSLKLIPGDVVEVALPNDDGSGWGAHVVFRLRGVDPVDSSGQYSSAEFGGDQR